MTAKKRTPKSEAFYKRCECGATLPRGYSSDYDEECPMCGKIVHVEKFKKPETEAR